MQDKQEIKFHIVPKNKKLLKSSKVRKYFKMVEKKVAHEMKEQNIESKVAESIALGVPLMMHEDGSLELIENYSKHKTEKYQKEIERFLCKKRKT